MLIRFWLCLFIIKLYSHNVFSKKNENVVMLKIKLSVFLKQTQPKIIGIQHVSAIGMRVEINQDNKK